MVWFTSRLWRSIAGSLNGSCFHEPAALRKLAVQPGLAVVIQTDDRDTLNRLHRELVVRHPA